MTDDDDSGADGDALIEPTSSSPPAASGLRLWGPKSKRSAILVCAAIALHAAHVVSPGPFDVFAVLGVWIVAGAALTYRDYRAAHVVLLSALMTLPRVVTALAVWPLHFLVPLVAYGALLLVLPRPPALRWLRRGAMDLRTVGIVLAVIVVSALGLAGWFLTTRPDVSDETAGLPPWPLYSLVVLGVGFALLNAAMEEAIWRGVMLGGLDATTARPAFAVGVQALSFGAVHLHGFPRGALGMAMAAVYGVMLGALRLRARGMLAPFLAHVGTDVVVFTLLLWSLRD